MNYFSTGYEAPSTAHENPGHPALAISGCQRLELISALTVLPRSVTLKARCVPFFCEKDISVSLNSYDLPPIQPYTSHPALEHIDLWLDKEGHYCLIQGVHHPIDIDPQWNALLIDKPFYSMKFNTLEADVSFRETDGFIPYGGSFAQDPAQCMQTHFKAQWDQDHIGLTLRSDHGSLKSLIETQKIGIFLTYSDQTYKYTSVSYTLNQEKELFIEFIASF